MPAFKKRLRGLLNVVHEMLAASCGGMPGIDKPNQVRDGVIAEDQVHLGLLVLEAMDGVQLLCQIAGQVAMAVAREREAQAAAQDFFVGGHPLHAQTLRDGQWLLPKHCPPTAKRPADESQKLFDADSVRAVIARAHLPDGESDSGARAGRAWKPRPCWYRRPVAESGDRTAEVEISIRPCWAASACAGRTLASSSRSRAITKR